MVSLSSLRRYTGLKLDYSTSLSVKRYERGQITRTELLNDAWKILLVERLTYFYWNKGKEMAPTIGGPGGSTLLVRKLPDTDSSCVSAGDVVVLRDPLKADNYLVRRLAAIEGSEMVSKDKKAEPFVLEKDQCWVLSDNKNLNPKETMDSQNFGPVPMKDIVGRVIYSLRTAVDHGPVQNRL